MITGLVLYYAFIFVVATLAVGRVTRLFVDDEFPPMMALRIKYLSYWHDENEDGTPKRNKTWGELLVCPFCISFWIALVNGLLAWLSFNGLSDSCWLCSA